MEERLRERYLATAPAKATRRRRRRKTRPQRERVLRILEELHPSGAVPGRNTLSNADLIKEVDTWTKKAGESKISDTTILRAAGRRKERK